MKRFVFCLTLTTCSAVLFLGVPGLADPPEVRSINDKILAKQKERRFALRQALTIAREAMRAGMSDMSTVLRVTDTIRSAEMELATNQAERIAARERLVELHKENEKLAVSLEDLAGKTQVLEAKAARLQAEIELLWQLANPSK
jgi:hypothetical protein